MDPRTVASMNRHRVVGFGDVARGIGRKRAPPGTRVPVRQSDIRAMQVEAEYRGSTKVGATKVGPASDGVAEVGASEAGSGRGRLLQHRLHHSGAPEIRAPQVRLTEDCSLKPCLAEFGVGELRIQEHRRIRGCAGQSGACHPGSGELTLGEVRVTQIHPHEVRFLEVASRQMQPAQAPARQVGANEHHRVGANPVVRDIRQVAAHERGVGQLRTAHVRAPEGAVHDEYFVHVNRAQARSIDRRLRQRGAAEARPGQVRFGQVGFGELGVLESGATQVHSRRRALQDRHPVEGGVFEACVIHPAQEEPRSGQPTAREIGASEVALDERGILQVSVREAAALQLQLGQLPAECENRVDVRDVPCTEAVAVNRHWPVSSSRFATGSRQ